jgi:formylglycine-generating enzyme required for sulfatase activity/tRNA A-37 threonylcarbamoyl transferase component Bud32
MDGARTRWLAVRALLEAALELPPEQREAHVQAHSGGDAELAAEVLRLVRHESGLARYLEPPEVLARAARELAAPDEALVGERLGVWRLERTIGSGGMGTVHLARREGGDFEQRAAVKVLRVGLDSPRMQQGFRRERQLLAQLEHPGIARLLDGGIAPSGLPFLVMEYVEGRPIDVWCDERGLDVRARVALFTKVCDAVHHAHQHLVVHRDIKPANVLVDGRGEPKLLDFGLAKVVGDEADAEVTQAGLRALTPAYASPEQLRGDAVTTASDVYSLGVVLFQLLTGRLPHPTDGASISAVAQRVQDVAAPRPSAVAGDRLRARELRGDLDAIVLQALRKEPGRRYPSARALSRDLERHLAGRPVEARPESLVYLGTSFVRRHRALVALSALALAALVAGLVVSSRLWLLARARAAEVTRLSDATVLRALATDADMLWPPVPEAVPKMDLWLGHADALLARLPLHAERLRELREQGSREGDTWRFDSSTEAWEHEILAHLVADLERLGTEPAAIGSRAEMARRRAFAAAVDERTLTGPAAAAAWREAQHFVAGSEHYHGLVLEPLRGLLPLGPDPDSGLLEFWHPQTGVRPERDRDGRLVPTADTSLVFVLVPGGAFRMGSPPDEPGHAPEEGPRHTVELAPFLVSKYELTQGQWERVVGTNPAALGPHTRIAPDLVFTLAHPVESVTFEAGRRWLDRTGLDYPTEAQWEYAARAGTDTPWWSGAARESLAGAANLADAAAAARGQDWLEIADWPEHDDGHAFHAPVGSYRANAFGLHDVHGNVCEWCDDVFGDYADPAQPGDGRRSRGFDRNLPIRGGSFSNGVLDLRSARRVTFAPDVSAAQIGLRPVRRL